MGRPHGVCEPTSPTQHLTVPGPAVTQVGEQPQAIRKQEMSEIILDCEKRLVGVQVAGWGSGGQEDFWEQVHGEEEEETASKQSTPEGRFVHANT